MRRQLLTIEELNTLKIISAIKHKPKRIKDKNMPCKKGKGKRK